MFGASVAHNRPGAFVSGVSWHDGWWIAYGGAADGYEAIWVSRDAARWDLALDSRSSGSVDGVVETGDGSLFAYGAGSTPGRSNVEIGWYTKDPTVWGRPVPIDTPGRYALQFVTPGAALAVGADIDRPGVRTPALRSADGGRTWHEDSVFGARFPTAWAWTAASAAGLDVVAGTRTDANLPAVWLSNGDSAWTSGPVESQPPKIPTTSIPYIPPKGSVSLVASIDNRIVIMGLAADLDRYYVFDVAQVPPVNNPLATEHDVPGLAGVMQRVRGFEQSDGPLAYAEVVATTRGQADALFGSVAQGASDRVYLVRMVGHFVCNECSHLTGEAPHGDEIRFVYNPAGGLPTSFGIGGRPTDLSQFGRVYRLPVN